MWQLSSSPRSPSDSGRPPWCPYAARNRVSARSMVAVRMASGADRAPLRRSPLLLLLRLTTAVAIAAAAAAAAAAIAATATRGLPLTARRRRNLVHAVIEQDSLRVVGLERQNWSRASNPSPRARH